MRLTPRSALCALALLSACRGEDPMLGGGPPPVDRPEACGDLDFPSGIAQSTSGLVNASSGPLLPLTRAQEQAFVAVWSVAFDQLLCSGTLIGPELVLTAEHCVSSGDMEVRFGPSARDPAFVAPVRGLRPHPELDLALLELETTPPFEVTPIALATSAPEPELIGEWLETAGFGQSLVDFDERGFLPVRVQSVTTDFLDVQGGGRQGLCFGDSGAPLLTLDPGRRDVRVWGVLSAGDADCLGRDRFALIRRAVDFFSGEATVPEGPPTCGDTSVEGRCTPAGRLVTCTLDGVASTDCREGCGWTGTSYACTSSASGSCGREGPNRCDGDRLRWCDQGLQRLRDCSACGETCVETEDRAFCAHPLCPGLDEGGRCARDVVEWCDATGRFRQFDCRRVGQRCLPDPARCEGVPEDCADIGSGVCRGPTRIYCEGSTVLWESCAAADASCTDGDCS